MEKIDQDILDFTDIYIVKEDISLSYVYYKGDDSPRQVDQQLLPHIKGMLHSFEKKRNELNEKNNSGIQFKKNIFNGLDTKKLLRETLIKNTSLDQVKIDQLVNKVDIQKNIEEIILNNLKEFEPETGHHSKDISFTYLDRNFRSYTIEGQKNSQLVCRQNFSKNIDLQTTGLHPLIMKYLLSPELSKGGLILLCGTNGSGKSTTSAALVKERLKKHKGFCMTVEDPVEIPIEGKHGDGICIQVQINPHEGFAPKIRELMRAYPTGQNLLLLIGEIRDGDTAAQVLKAAVDGRLVISTIHADNVESALKRLLVMASTHLPQEAAADLLADSFRICLHQSLINGTLKTKFLKATDGVNSIIKNNEISKLNSEIERQEIAINKNIEI